MLKFRSINILLACVVLAACPTWAGEVTTKAPQEIIQSSNTRILEIYQSTAKVDTQIQQKIFKVMGEVTDFATMGEQVTAGFCDPKAPQTCAELKKVFIDLLQGNAIRKLGHYRADRFDYTGQEIKGNQAVVRTTAHYKKDSVQLDYILGKRASGWMIVNYIADDVDTIQNYRRQFANILKKNSMVYLIDRLKKKNEEYQEEDSRSIIKE